MNPVRNSSPAIAGLETERGIISNGVNPSAEFNATTGFTKKYHIAKLVYYEETNDIQVAISREKQIKGWLRGKKIALIESVNPKWNDLSEGWFK